MKLTDLFESENQYEVREHHSGEVRFSGEFKKCIKWISDYDKREPEYLDLRIFDSSGKEKTN